MCFIEKRNCIWIIKERTSSQIRFGLRVELIWGCEPSHTKMDEEFAKFLNMFKKIEVNIPFAKALAQMPHYSKFMKDILSKKRKLDEEGVVSLSATCSAVIQKNFPLKM